MRFRILCLLLPLAVLPLSACLEVDVGFILGIYGPWNYTQLASVGIDARYDNAWEWCWPQGPERVLERFRRNSLEAAANNVTYVAGLYYLVWDIADHATFDYVRAVSKLGVEEEHTPSPVDRTYWTKLVEEPAIAVANLSLHYPIWGLVWDFELYAGYAWNPGDYSFDQPAIQAFGREMGESIPNLTPGEGHGWLQDRGLLGEFQVWQERQVYDMAKETETRVHAVNPNLSLGILGFYDSWRHWIILEAFSTNRSPVTLWTEDTYRGYDEERIDYLRQAFDERGLRGKVLPGLYTVALSPWDMIDNMERAIRHNGALWIYQYNGDQYKLADERTYSRAYNAFQRYVLFNASRANPLPNVYLYPGVEARPYEGPEGVTLLLSPRSGVSIQGDLELLTDSDRFHYVGKNITITAMEPRNLTRSEMPCLLHGLSKEDLIRTEAWSLLREIDTLMGLYGRLGLERLPGIEDELGRAAADFADSRYDLVKERLSFTVAITYAAVLNATWPSIEEATKSPRDSPIPILALSKIRAAERMYSRGDWANGNAYLVGGLEAWAMAVPETACDALIAAQAIGILGLFGRWLGPRASQGLRRS